ncbi:MAG: hypothetical protein U1E19_05695 [Rhodoblastus sp.]
MIAFWIALVALAMPAMAGFCMAFAPESVHAHLRGRGGAWKGRYQAATQ